MSNNLEDGIISSREDLAQYLTDSTEDPQNNLEKKLQEVLLFSFQGGLFEFRHELLVHFYELEVPLVMETIIGSVNAWADEQLRTVH